MKKATLHAALFVLILLRSSYTFAQCDPYTLSDPAGYPCKGYTSQTSATFLRIAPDARSGAMGDIGIALTPDANALTYNASKLAMADKKWGISVNYTPWIRREFNSEMYLSHQAAYFQFGKKIKQAIGLDYKYFSLGVLQWESSYHGGLREGAFHEKAFTGAYALKLNHKWAVGLSVKSIRSTITKRPDFLSPNAPTYPFVTNLRSFAMDISTTYKQPISILGVKTNLLVGTVLSNVGQKMPYAYAYSSDFLPTNLGLGGSWAVPFNQNNKLLLAFELNKLLVVAQKTTDTADANRNYVPDWKEVSVSKNMLQSFSDSPNGFKGELKEIRRAWGLEYWFKDCIVLRTGYSYQSRNTGGRNFYTFGGGLRYKAVNLNVSYLKSLYNADMTDGTWRFSLLLNNI